MIKTGIVKITLDEGELKEIDGIDCDVRVVDFVKNPNEGTEVANDGRHALITEYSFGNSKKEYDFGDGYDCCCLVS